ncbi:MAG: VOC family protein [Xanthomonadales bacterium]|nr:VOC family protein [Xanthomonadales bacterium]
MGEALIRLAVALLATLPGTPTWSSTVRGLDHVIIAVADLESARARFADLGFVLKPGRPHANGIRNLHIKFEDGTEIELLTVDEPTDALARTYLEHLSAGSGPVYAGLFAPDRDDLLGVLRKLGLEPSVGALITLAGSSGLGHLFFGRRNHAPTDRPGHFAHGNGARSLIGLWLAPDDSSSTVELLTRLGAEEVMPRNDGLGQSWEARMFRLPEGFVALVDRRYRSHPKRPIVGITLQGTAPRIIPPSEAEGLWIEFQARAPSESADE